MENLAMTKTNENPTLGQPGNETYQQPPNIYSAIRFKYTRHNWHIWNCRLLQLDIAVKTFRAWAFAVPARVYLNEASQSTIPDVID
ncbi:hypothetical protein X798_03627 [Onchocerca flexuosa]|uniref:Uncharacterized protein n=1 Tax=Onchocerca flexuosa TaxID=387005 RepID=A0A238BVC4_9BILA|nr:hypothetical protein X798_03627 [Onchocerca flexuosa]